VEQKTPSGGGPDRPARRVGSRKRARAFPKGRQLDIEALDEVRALLQDWPRRHDLLIEYLHLIQDRYHSISARHLKALCEELRLPQAAAYEAATFYAHFDVLKEDETPPPSRSTVAPTSRPGSRASAAAASKDLRHRHVERDVLAPHDLGDALVGQGLTAVASLVCMPKFP